jgi:AraC-like DNA-binding protein
VTPHILATRRTFSRLFKERYSITPTEYRQQLASR